MMGYGVLYILYVVVFYVRRLQEAVETVVFVLDLAVVGILL